jgi:RNase P subunit RPR2
MVFKGNLIANLLNGDEITCDKCQKGVLRPRNPEIALNMQVLFVCDNCGDLLHIHRKIDEKPKCLQ